MVLADLEDQDTLAFVALHDSDSSNRRVAADVLQDPALLAEVVAASSDVDIRQRALQGLVEHPEQLLEVSEFAMRFADNAVVLALIQVLEAPEALALIAKERMLDEVRTAALGKLDDSRTLMRLANGVVDFELCEASRRRLIELNDAQCMAEIATDDSSIGDRCLAMEILRELHDDSRTISLDTELDVRSLFARVAVTDSESVVRCSAMSHMYDTRVLSTIASGSDVPEDAAFAANRVRDLARYLADHIYDEEENLVLSYMKRGISPDATDSEGLAALHHLANTGNLALAGLLLEHGASTGLKTSDGDTPLTLASNAHRHEIVALLQETHSEGVPTGEEDSVNDDQSVLGLTVASSGDVRDVLDQARALKNEGESSQAVRLLTSAIEAAREADLPSGDLGPLHNNLGNLYREMRRFLDAIRELKTAIERDPRLEGPSLNIALCYDVGLGRPLDAVEFYRAEIDLAPDARTTYEAYLNLGIHYQETDPQLDRSIELLERAITVCPDGPDLYSAYNSLAVAWYHKEETDKAIECWKKVVELAPETEAGAMAANNIAVIGDL